MKKADQSFYKFKHAAARLRTQFALPPPEVALQNHLRAHVTISSADWQLKGAQPPHDEWLVKGGHELHGKAAFSDEGRVGHYNDELVNEKLITDMAVDVGVPVAACAFIDYQSTFGPLPQPREGSTGPLKASLLVSAKLGAATESYEEGTERLPPLLKNNSAVMPETMYLRIYPHLIPAFLSVCVLNMAIQNDDDHPSNFVVVNPEQPRHMYGIDMGINCLVPTHERGEGYSQIAMQEVFGQLALQEYVQTVRNTVWAVENYPSAHISQLARRLKPVATEQWNAEATAHRLDRQRGHVRQNVRKAMDSRTRAIFDRFI